MIKLPYHCVYKICVFKFRFGIGAADLQLQLPWVRQTENNTNGRVKKIQLETQLILSIFLQPLHVSGVSRPIIRRYNCIYTTVGTYYSF